jgi:hypothetical protein
MKLSPFLAISTKAEEGSRFFKQMMLITLIPIAFSLVHESAQFGWMLQNKRPLNHNNVTAWTYSAYGK